MANELRNPADANAITRAYFDGIRIEERLVGATLPDIRTRIFGKEYSSPIMTPAFSHMKSLGEGRESAMVEYARAAKELNVLNWFGMEPDEVAGEIFATGADSVRIIKPFKDHKKILDQIAYSESHDAAAVGVDIDHVFDMAGIYDIVDGEEMGLVTEADIAEYAAATSLPFIIKGVLSVHDAVKCADAGAKGIVVSHHHGRLPYALPPVAVLPEIKKALAGRDVAIFVDCSVDTGVDAYKALALGADGVSVGRAMMKPLQENGTAGVAEKIRKMNGELIGVMGYAGAPSLDLLDPSTLWIASPLRPMA